MTQTLDSLTASELEDLLRLSTPSERAEIDKILSELEASRQRNKPLWTPLPGPQTRAVECQADELFFGGGGGGGKSDSLLGIALTRHRHAVIFRREYPQLRGLILRSKEIVGQTGRFNANDCLWTLGDGRFLEFGACQHEEDKERWQGRAHDFIGFDELAHFTKSQYRFLIGWNRSAVAGQRCRVVATGNPPTTPEGRWVVEEWQPWLDNTYHDPATPGELRWYANIDGKLEWLKSGEPIQHNGETIYPRSRTFIPALVDDNPYLSGTAYKSVLQGLPEPLRSQMLFGDFSVGLADDDFQVCPTAWIRAAQARWSPTAPEGLSAIGCDVARGGSDKTTLAPRHGRWFDRLRKHPGKATPDGQSVVALLRQALLANRRATVNVDVIGVGASVYDIGRQEGLAMKAIHFAEKAPRKDRTGQLAFVNYRAWAWWSMREALDPENGDNLALPPDPELLADLAAPRWSMTAGGIRIEAKDDVKRRIGRSPDCGDAVVLANIQSVPLGPGTIGLPGEGRGGTSEVDRLPAGVFGDVRGVGDRGGEGDKDRDGKRAAGIEFPHW